MVFTGVIGRAARRPAALSLRCLAAGAAAALLAGCGSTGGTSSAPTATAVAATPTPAAATTADLQAVFALLYPSSAGGGDCFQGSASPTPSVASCPVTPRLAAALTASVSNGAPGGGADPVCGCQNIDAAQSAAYVVGTPAGGGMIKLTSFAAERLTYVVIRSGRAFLVDDIWYCGPTPSSIYPAETATSC